MLDIMMRDNVKRRVQMENGDYEHVRDGDEKLDSQIYFYEEAYKNAKLAQENPQKHKERKSNVLRSFLRKISKK